MLEKFNQLCKEENISLFGLKTRFSNESKERWNFSFLGKQLENINNNEIKKIWVCGPPIMNEEFDRNLEKLCPKLNIDRNIIEIL